MRRNLVSTNPFIVLREEFYGSLVFSLFGIAYMLHSLVKTTLLSWHGHFAGKKRKKACKVAPLCLSWTIWEVRNRRVFDNAELLDLEFKSSFMCNFLEWVKGGLRMDPCLWLILFSLLVLCLVVHLYVPCVLCVPFFHAF